MHDTNLFYLREMNSNNWDNRKNKATKIENLYSGTIFNAYFKRIKECSGYLKFKILPTKTEEIRLKLESAKFCRVRACPFIYLFFPVKPGHYKILVAVAFQFMLFWLDDQLNLKEAKLAGIA